MKGALIWLLFAVLVMAAVVTIQFLFVQPLRDLNDSRIWRTGICAQAQPCPST